MLLAGDAAGLTHPITGAGILNAVISGTIAGQVVGSALARKRLQTTCLLPAGNRSLFFPQFRFGPIK
ncbi:MAG: NAD(P)/FAD-dependent oxidoreductase [Zhaonellaceae bacterium]